ncbi:MAG: aminopeptidase P N-terminal domain-containing protein [Chloroflexi bacterium]|nr:aminopeptidase P N-terminal domain-containing protein [Chloroflexota bacterium]
MNAARMATQPQEFRSRRRRLMDSLTGGAIVIAAGHDSPRNNDVDHQYRQESSFWYLTGFDEPDAVAVLRPGSTTPYTLFVRPYDPTFEIWMGRRAGVRGAVGPLGANAAYPVEQLDAQLPRLLAECDTIYYALGSDDRVDGIISGLVKQRRRMAQRGAKSVRRIEDPTAQIDAMRQVKSDDEIALLQRAIDITAVGFEAAMQTAAPGIAEYEVQAAMERSFRHLGSPRNGYPSIVAGGSNACVLHYVRNEETLGPEDLLLIDAGAEYGYYTADVTRTWPVSGEFTPAQRAVYDIVLDSQKKAIDAVKPGVGFDDVHRVATRVLIQGLIDLGIMKGEVEQNLSDAAYRDYYMHATSHWLGLDVHDCGPYRDDKGQIRLRPGMVLTIEPGLYFGPQAKQTPEEYRGIGIRIEDDVLVTEDGCRVLSEAIPKEPDELEAIVMDAR